MNECEGLRLHCNGVVYMHVHVSVVLFHDKKCMQVIKWHYSHLKCFLSPTETQCLRLI